MQQTPMVGLYKSIYHTERTTSAQLDKAIASIAAPPRTRVHQIVNVRTSINDDQRRARKSALPCATWAGLFDKGRKDKAHSIDSQVRYVDADAVPADKAELLRLEDKHPAQAAPFRKALREDAAITRDILATQEWCFAAWLSASGMGVGILARSTNWQDVKHAVNETLEAHYRSFTVDNSASNPARMNYLSHDDGLHYNKDAVEVPKAPTLSDPRPKPCVPSASAFDKEPIGDRVEKALAAISRITFDPPGSLTRNYQLAVVGSLSGYVNADLRCLQAVRERLEAAGRTRACKLWDEKWWFQNANDEAGLFIHYCQKQGAWPTARTQKPTGPIEAIDADAFIAEYL